jgi:prevent-host-death family protein
MTPPPAATHHASERAGFEAVANHLSQISGHARGGLLSDLQGGGLGLDDLRRAHGAIADRLGSLWLIPEQAPTSLASDVRFYVRSLVVMPSVSATEARRRLYALIDEVGQSHEAVQITGKRGNAVLLSEDDWRAIQETLHLVSIPGMRESILEGMAVDVSELSSNPGW